MYNYWIALALDIVLIVFWIISPTLLLIDFTIKFYDYKRTALLQYVAGGFAAIEFLLFLISAIIIGICIYHHRRAGLHSIRLLNGTIPTSTSHDAVPEEKSQPTSPVTASSVTSPVSLNTVLVAPVSELEPKPANISELDSKQNPNIRTVIAVNNNNNNTANSPTSPTSAFPPGATYVYVVPQQQGQSPHQSILYPGQQIIYQGDSGSPGGYQYIAVPAPGQQPQQPQQQQHQSIYYYPASPGQTQAELPGQRMDEGAGGQEWLSQQGQQTA
ncbi:hypothetical protein VTJ04DRAFT_10558 [Mycothermus thermophilus]|uniref:uncharacterized protein n=1 Tax=Humicola insolens TaxID=85995 RepID=UPI003742B07B